MFDPLQFEHRNIAGLDVYFHDCPSSPLVRAHCGARVGLRATHRGLHGTAHLLEHMLINGSVGFPERDAIAHRIKASGGYHNAFTNADMTCIDIETSSLHFSKALGLMLREAFQPLLRAEDLATEREIVKAEAAERRRFYPATSYTQKQVAEHLFTHNLSVDADIGSNSDLDETAIDDLRDFHAMQWRPDNMFLIIAGSTNWEVITEIICRESPVPPTSPIVIAPREERELVVKNRAAFMMQFKEIATPSTLIVLMGPDRSDFQRCQLSKWLDAFLAQSFFGWWYQELREKLGLIYRITASFVTDKRFSALQWYCYYQREQDGQQIADTLLVGLDKLPGYIDQNLDKWRGWFPGKLLRDYETMDKRCSRALFDLQYFGRIRSYAEMELLINNTQAEDFISIANEFFRPDQAIIGQLLPE